jgi:archaellum component FlaC
LITGATAIIVAVLGTASAVLVQALRGRNEDKPEVIIAPANGNGGKTNERVAVLERRQDDSDDELDVVDKQLDGYGRRMDRHEGRLEHIERWLDLNEPGWRRG